MQQLSSLFFPSPLSSPALIREIADKLCRICQIRKGLSEFYKKRSNADGYTTECKGCRHEIKKEYGKDCAHKIRESGLKWVANNPEKKLAYDANRRASKLKATPPWVDKDALLAVYTEAAEKKLQVDHIVPLVNKSVCGLHVPWNLQLLTKTENCKKGNRFIS